MRDRLIELITEGHEKWKHGVGDWKMIIADHLIANGVGFTDDLRAENKRLLEALELLESENSVPADNTEIGMLINPNDRM